MSLGSVFLPSRRLILRLLSPVVFRTDDWIFFVDGLTASRARLICFVSAPSLLPGPRSPENNRCSYDQKGLLSDSWGGAEKVLPYARFLAKTLKLPVELLQVIDVVEIAKRIAPENAHFLNTVIENAIRKSEEYLRRVAGTVPGADVKCIVEKGWPEDVIIEKAAMDKGTLISMATHGRSGINRWLLGSVAEKVLRGATTPVFLARATEDAKSEGEAPLHAVIVPLDGSKLAEQDCPQQQN
jgi:nucleotide-binding universal stress UspA family protein